MESNIVISEGTTYEYLVHGLIVTLIALLCIPFFWYAAIPFGIIAIGIFTISTGIEIDLTNKKLRKYQRFFGYKSGIFTSLQTIVFAKLVMNSNTTKLNYAMRNMAWRESPVRFTTYDLILIDDIDQQKIFNQFTKYTLANKVMKALAKVKTLESINEVDIALRTQRKNRRR